MDKLFAMLEAFFKATAWKIDKPPAYGWFHLTFVIVGAAVSVLLAKRLRNIGDKGSRILLLGIGLLLMAAELYKQLFYFFVVQPGEYSWWIFPFQLCSVPMYMCVIAPLLKPGKLQNGMYSFMMLYNLLGGGIAFAEPSGLLLDYATLTAHAMTWHMLLVFVGLYLVFSGRGGSEMKDYKASTYTFLCLCIIALCINLSFWDVSDGSINMFFVGPRNSSLIVFKQIAEAFGWYVSTALYIPVVCLGAYLLFLLIRLYRSHSTKKEALAISQKS